MKLMVLSRHRMLAEALGQVVSGPEHGLELVGCSDSGREGLEIASEHGVELAIIDVQLRELNGLDTTCQLLMGSAKTVVLMMSEDPDVDPVSESLAAGASGYIGMNCGLDEFSKALAALRCGENYLCSAATASLVRSSVDKEDTDEDPRLSRVTPREREVLQLLAEGSSSQEIAERLSISSKTVDTHRRHIMQKLEAESVADLVKHAIRAGLTSV